MVVSRAKIKRLAEKCTRNPHSILTSFCVTLPVWSLNTNHIYYPIKSVWIRIGKIAYKWMSPKWAYISLYRYPIKTTHKINRIILFKPQRTILIISGCPNGCSIDQRLPFWNRLAIYESREEDGNNGINIAWYQKVISRYICIWDYSLIINSTWRL